ncbi:MAG: hypothetical protein FWE45_03070 [Firmicutes bacterium]|nr:hypothetical protein [Bacillota bacterium]
MSKSSSGRGRGSALLNLLSFIAVVFVGIALLISLIFNWAGGSESVSGAFSTIASVLALIVVGFYSFIYVRARRNLVMWIFWVVAVVLIVLYYGFAAFG